MTNYELITTCSQNANGTAVRGAQGRRGRRSSRSRSVAGPRSHPEVRRGAWRRRGMEWERPHTLSGRSAEADDAEGMSGKSRNRLAPVLTEASSWTSDRRARDRFWQNLPDIGGRIPGTPGPHRAHGVGPPARWGRVGGGANHGDDH